LADTDQVVFVYATFPDVTVAEKVAGHLVEARLAACANILPGMVSVYRWQDAIAREGEVAAIFKTRAVLAEALIAEGVRQHPYETPAFVILPVAGGAGGFVAWILDETRGGSASQ